MAKVLEKTERRLGEKLFLKGERCIGPKCAVSRRGYPPGAHGKTGRRRRDSSELGALLREKQIIRLLYNLDDRDIKQYINKATVQKGVFTSNVLHFLEHRLDNLIYRLGLADSRRAARQEVVHGHITVDGSIVRTPSYQVKKGQTIGIREQSLKKGVFADIQERLKKIEPPIWLSLDKNSKTGSLISEIDIGQAEMPADIAKIKEFYSR